MNRRNFLALSFGVGAVTLLAGCGSGGGKIALPGGGNTPPGGGTGTPATPGRGGVAGYVFRDGTGRLQVGYTSTAAPGTTPVAGVQVGVVGDSTATAVSGADGAFHLESAPAGLGTLHLTPASGSAPLELPLTVIKDAVIQVGAPPVARDKAIEAARTALAVDLTEAVICATQQPLPVGVTLRSAEDNIAGATGGYVTPAPQWLVYADLKPAAQFGHPTRFCLVDAATGAAVVQEQQFWPVVNGAHYYGDAARGADAADVVQGQTARAISPLGQLSVSSRAVHAALSRAEREGTTRALVVKGWPRLDFKGDTLNIPTLFGSGGLPGSTPVVLEPPSADKTKVLDAWSQICSQATMDDVVFFFLSTHGSEKGYATLATNIRAPDGTPLDDRNPVQGGADYLIEHLLPSDLIPAMADCLACEIILVIETCYSGFWASTMQSEAPAKLQSCTTLTVLTATDNVHVGWGEVDDETKTGSSFYVNQLVTAYGQIASGTPAGQSVSLFQAHSRASAALLNSGNEKAGRDQNPQFYQRTPEAGMVCGVSFSPTSASVEPKDLKTADFAVQVCGTQPADGKYRYEFTTTGRQGVILSVTNTTGSTSITSDHAVIGYLAKSDAEEGQTDDINVRVLTNDNTNRLVGTAKATVTMGKAGDYVIEAFTVDDNMTLWLNGTVVAGDQDGAFAGSRGPFTLTGSKKGDSIRLQVRDWYGFYASCSDVYIQRPNGTRRQWITGFQEQTPQGTHKVILDQTTTLD